MKTSLRFIVISDIKSPQKRYILVKWNQAVRIANEVQILRERATILRTTTLPTCLTMIENYSRARWLKLPLTNNTNTTENRFVYPVSETICLKTPIKRTMSN